MNIKDLESLVLENKEEIIEYEGGEYDENASY